MPTNMFYSFYVINENINGLTFTIGKTCIAFLTERKCPHLICSFLRNSEIVCDAVYKILFFLSLQMDFFNVPSICLKRDSLI